MALRHTTIMACLAVALAASTVNAQGRRGFGGDPTLGLLAIEKVQKELDLAGPQIDLIEKLGEDLQKQFPRPQINFFNATEKERSAAMKKMEENAKKRAPIVAKNLKNFLSPGQLKRLSELRIQQQGLQALMDNDVAKKVKLSDADRKKITKLMADARAKITSTFRKALAGGGANADFAAIRKKTQKMQADAEKQVLAVLSATQKKAFEDLKGKKFEFPQRQFGGGGGRRGRPKKKS